MITRGVVHPPIMDLLDLMSTIAEFESYRDFDESVYLLTRFEKSMNSGLVCVSFSNWAVEWIIFYSIAM